MDKKNLSILKLIFFQSSFLMLNLYKNCLDKEELNWFYQFYQVFFFKTSKLLNTYEKNFNSFFIEKKSLDKNTNDFFHLYKFMYDYIENNKEDYNNLTI